MSVDTFLYIDIVLSPFNYKRLSPCNRTKAIVIVNHLLHHTIICVSNNGGNDRHPLLTSVFERCSSEVIFKYILLAPDFHHLRLALPFQYTLLSSSMLFYILFHYNKETLESSRVSLEKYVKLLTILVSYSVHIFFQSDNIYYFNLIFLNAFSYIGKLLFLSYQ